MSEVQHAAQSFFTFVGGYNFGLQLHRLSDEPLQLNGIPLENLCPVQFETQEQFYVSDDAALEGFVKPRPKLAIRKRLQHGGIDQNRTWVIERP